MSNTLVVILWPRLGFTAPTFWGVPATHHVCLYFTLVLNTLLDAPSKRHQAARGCTQELQDPPQHAKTLSQQQGFS